MKKSRFARKAGGLADRGKEAEKAAQGYLEKWEAASTSREFNRLPDTKAAGRTIKAAPADFEFYADRRFGLIEAKQTEHEYRLERAKVTQLARLRKRAKCGGICLVVVFHSTLNKWRVVLAPDLMEFGDKGSWNLSEFKLYDTVGDALNSMFPGIFEVTLE